MAYTFRNTTGGNPGVNRKLTVAEADGNTLESKNRIAALEGQSGKQIEEITSSGSALTIHYTDSTTDGPFPLPISLPNPVGVWTNSTPYSVFDVVRVPGVGTFMCMVAHTSDPAPAEFDASQTEEGSDGSDLLWFQIGVDVDIKSDVAFAVMGRLPEVSNSDGVLIGQFVVIRECVMETTLETEAEAWLETPGVNSDGIEIHITKNGTAIGEIFFDPDEQDGSFTFDEEVEFAKGDRIALWLMVGDTDQSDGFGAADLSVTLPATRTDI